MFFSEFKNPICYILLITLTLSFIIGEYVDAIFILFVVLIDALLGSVQEYKSSKSAEALKKIGVIVFNENQIDDLLHFLKTKTPINN